MTDHFRRIHVVAGGLATLAIVALWFSGEPGSALFAAGLLIVVAGGFGIVAKKDPLLATAAWIGLTLRFVVIGMVSAFAAVQDSAPHLFADEAGFFEFATFSANALRSGADPRLVLLTESSSSNPFRDVYALLLIPFGGGPGVIKVLNAVVGVLVALVGYEILRLLFDRSAARVGALLLLFFPSLFLWSVVGLRDIWVVLLLAVVALSLERLRQRAQWRWLAVGLVALAWLQGVRTSMLPPVSIAYVLATVISLRKAGRVARWSFVAVAFAFGYAFLIQLSGYGFLGVGLYTPSTLSRLADQSSFFALGARSAFQQGRPTPSPHVLVLPAGEVVRIEASPKPGASPTPAPTLLSPGQPSKATATPTPAPTLLSPGQPSKATATPAVIVVQPGQQVVLIEPGDPTPFDPRRVYVRRGDLVVLQAAKRVGDPRPLVLGFGDENYVELRSYEDETGAAASIRRIADLLPRGLLFLILAPFPGLTHTGLEIPALAEMIPWAAALVAACSTIWRYRDRWLDLVPLTLPGLIILLILATVEGNVGVLMRHRSMLLVYVLILAAPTVNLGWSTIRRGASEQR